ncbi:MAG: STAS domain-containing protein [Actinomycetota bacterium]|nr:STAS domain-containing protein [Actinomycetota bacterium]
MATDVWVGIGVSEHREGCVVTLRGEFDVLHLSAISETLMAATARGRKTFVDLSKVTFLDTLCVRELAMLGLLYADRLVFCDPSREARLSVAACEMEDLVPFREGGEEPGRRCPLLGASRRSGREKR